MSTDDDAAVGAHHAVLALVERRVAAEQPLDAVARALALGRVDELERAAPEQPFAGWPSSSASAGFTDVKVCSRSRTASPNAERSKPWR